MTKDQKIKEAYGEYFELIENDIQNDEWGCGWLFLHHFKDQKRQSLFHKIQKNLGRESHPMNYGFRPKPLHGIENNNGWIKIEREDDLPEESGIYFVFAKTWYKPFYRVDVFCGRLKNSFDNNKSCFTHYQPITKPQPPIY